MFRSPLFQFEWHSSSTPDANTCTQPTMTIFLSHQGLTPESASLSSQGKFDPYQVIWYQILICLLCFVFLFHFTWTVPEICWTRWRYQPSYQTGAMPLCIERSSLPYRAIGKFTKEGFIFFLNCFSLLCLMYFNF